MIIWLLIFILCIIIGILTIKYWERLFNKIYKRHDKIVNKLIDENETQQEKESQMNKITLGMLVLEHCGETIKELVIEKNIMNIVEIIAELVDQGSLILAKPLDSSEPSDDKEENDSWNTY